MIALNKWDIVDDKDDKTYLKVPLIKVLDVYLSFLFSDILNQCVHFALQAIDNIRSNLPILKWADIVLISAKTGQRTEKLFDAVNRAAMQFQRRISTSVLNEVVHDATLWMPPPTIGAFLTREYILLAKT